VWILLPQYGIMGYIITVYFTELINATLSITKLLCVTKVKFKLLNWLIKPILAIIASTTAFCLILNKFNVFAQSKTEIIFHIIVVSLVYLLILILIKAISANKIKKSIINFFKA
jgi:stage V sporulation protein B